MYSAAATTISPIADTDGILTELYMTHYSSLVGMARLLLRDHDAAEEVAQDAFIRVRASWRGIRDPERSAAYLRSAVLNGARSRLRRVKVATAHAAREGAAEASASTTSGDPAEKAQASDQRGRLLDQIRSLPPRQRDCVLLRYYLDLNEAEMASTLGISTGSIKTHLSRGLATLAIRMEDNR